MYLAKMARARKHTCGPSGYMMNGVGCVSCGHICPDNGDDWRQCRTDCPAVFGRHRNTPIIGTPGTTTESVLGPPERTNITTTHHTTARVQEIYARPWFAPVLLSILALVAVSIGAIVYRRVPRSQRFLDELLDVFRRCGNAVPPGGGLSVSASDRVSPTHPVLASPAGDKDQACLLGIPPSGSPALSIRSSDVFPGPQSVQYQRLPASALESGAQREFDMRASAQTSVVISNHAYHTGVDVHAGPSNSYIPVPEQGQAGRDRPGFLRQISTQSNPEFPNHPYILPVPQPPSYEESMSSHPAAVNGFLQPLHARSQASVHSHNNTNVRPAVGPPSEPDGTYKLETGRGSFDRLPNKSQ